MARASKYWVMVLLVVLVAVSAAVVVSAAADQAAPTFADRVEDAKKVGRDQAARVKGVLDTWKDWAVKTSGDWTHREKEKAGSAKGYSAKAADTLRSSTIQTHESVTGTVQRWGAWAKEAAGKFAGAGKKHVTNPAAEAAAYINSHIPKPTDSKEDEL